MVIRRLLVLVLLLPTACAMHKIQYYQMSLPAPSSSTDGAAAHGSGLRPSLAVVRLSTIQALEDARIHYRKGTNEVGTYEYHRWSDPPAVLVKEALVHTLQSSGNYSSVTDAHGSVTSDYVIRGRLLEFSELDSPAIETRVSIDLALYERKTGRIVWSGTLSHDEPVSGKKIEDVVKSMDRNLSTLLGQASNSIGSAISDKGVANGTGSGNPRVK